MASSVPPSDVATEEIIISAVVDGLSSFGDFRDVLTTGDFYDPKHRLIWSTVGMLFAKGRPINVVEIAAELHESGKLDAAGGSPFLGKLHNETPAVGNVMSLAERVAALGCKRRALAIIDDAAIHGRNGIQDVKGWLTGVAAQLTAVAGVEAEQPKAGRVHLLGPFDIFAQLPPIPWVIRGLDMCPGAPTLFAGYGYSGKTIVIQSMTLQIAAGLPVWRSFTAQQGGCVHFDYEQGEHLTRLRYQRLAWAADITPHDLDDRLQLVCFPPFYLDEPEAEGILLEVCQGKVLAVFDSFRAACRSTEENSSEARVPLDMLGRVSERTGCAMAVIHHARKVTAEAAGGARDSIRGSSALYDACGSVFVLEGQPDEPDRTMHHVKARVSGKTQEPMTLRIEDDGETGPDGSAAGLSVTASKAPTMEEREKKTNVARFDKLRQEVRGLFDAEPSQSSADAVARKLGRKAAPIRQVLKAMVEDGELKESGSTSTRRYDRVG